MITATDIKCMRLSVLLAGLIIIILLLIGIGIRVLLLNQIVPLIKLEEQINAQQVRTTTMRQHTLEYIQYPSLLTQQIVQQDITNWSQQSTLLQTHNMEYPDSVANALLKVAAPASGIRFYTLKIINDDTTNVERQDDYAQQTLYVGQNNIALVVAEQQVIDIAMDAVFTSFQWTVVLSVVIVLVLVVEGIILRFWLFKPLWAIYHDINHKAVPETSEV